MTPSTDPIILVGKLLALAIGVELAMLLAPHVIIILAGLIGAVFGLMGWRQCTRLEAAGYVLCMTAVAWLFAGSAAELVAQWQHIDKPGQLLAPASAAIAWVGHRWPAVGTWAARVARTAIERKPVQ